MAERLVYKFSSRWPTSEFTGGVYDGNKLKSKKTEKDQTISWIMAERSSVKRSSPRWPASEFTGGAYDRNIEVQSQQT